jgi:DNA-binding NarL/FixJ family response regulator
LPTPVWAQDVPDGPLRGIARERTIVRVAEPGIRVLLVDMPRLLSDLFERAFRSQEDMQIVGVRRTVEELPASAEQTGADYVIVGMDQGALPAECSELFRSRARPCVLGVAPGDGHVDLFELRPERIALGRVSPGELVDAVRAAAEARP